MRSRAKADRTGGRWSRSKGLIALLLTAALWGSSFPAIKLAVSSVSALTYTWARGAIALLGLAPYLLLAARRGRVNRAVVRGGLITGSVYALALWLQGWGTAYTTASNSAFITGLNVVFVHAYTALRARRYGKELAISLLLALAGLYLLTAPAGGLNIGDVLVLASSFLWAAQILLVDRYSRADPGVFAFFEILPSLAFLLPDLALGGWRELGPSSLAVLAYLGFFCGDLAFALQVMGQRHLSPAVSAVILLLEPVFASILAFLILGEVMELLGILGACLMLAAMYVAYSGERRASAPAAAD